MPRWASGLLDAFPEIERGRPQAARDASDRDPQPDQCVLDGNSGTGRYAGRNKQEKQCCCLSGGIDSPVAGYMIAKRGVDHRCNLFPCTAIYKRSAQSRRLLTLQSWLQNIPDRLHLHVVNFTDIQLAHLREMSA